MRTQYIITQGTAIIAVILIIGCLKSSSSVAPPSVAETAAFMTNTLDVLQARYQENDKQIKDIRASLDLLRQKYNITDTSPTQLDQTNQNGAIVVTSQQPYWEEKRKLAGMISFQRPLTTKIESDKLVAQLRTLGTN
jgi:hypothetical protein